MIDSSGLGPLTVGGRVAIIGGGPGGVAAAIALKKKTGSLGGNLHVSLIEGKNFESEQHHNQCVGVLSPPILKVFEQDLCISFPFNLVKSAVYGYVLHTRRREIILDGESEASYVFRRVQFDAYMIETARRHGVDIIPARATGLEFHPDRVVVYTESQPVKADVVIGAFGLDEGTAVLFQQAVGYRPPPAMHSIVTKYHPGDSVTLAFGNRIHAFLPAAAKIEFGGITPKSSHLTINIAGIRVDSEMMDLFLQIPEVRAALPYLEYARENVDDLQYYRGSFPRGLAHNISGDRYVMVGDAAGLVRAFKGKGVTSAIQTGLRAADTILSVGISGRAFQAYHKANREITDDLTYGKAMRMVTVLASQLGLMDIVIDAAQENDNLRQALFEAVSADKSYREVIRKVLTPSSTLAILNAILHSAQRVIVKGARS